MLGIKFLFKFNLLVSINEPNPRDWISLKTQHIQKNIHKKFLLLNSKILSKKEKKKKKLHRKHHSIEQIRNVLMCQCLEDILLAQVSHIPGKFS